MQSPSLRLGWLSLTVTLVTAVIGGLGAYPTLRWAGPAGLAGLGVAAVSVLTAVIVSAALTARVTRRSGPVRAAQVFLGTGLPRLAVTLGLAMTGRWALHLPIVATLGWTCLLYLPMLTVEGVWLSRMLKKIERINAGGELRHAHNGRY